MTREEAIQRLTDLQDGSGQTYEAIRMAIEALSAEYEDYEHATLVDIKEPLKVAVVRCKDCKNNYNTCTNHGKNQPMCDFTDRMLKETDFCSRAERRPK